jgi:hypothetical protein
MLSELPRLPAKNTLIIRIEYPVIAKRRSFEVKRGSEKVQEFSTKRPALGKAGPKDYWPMAAMILGFTLAFRRKRG